MSRSYRKPILTDGYNGGKRKRFEKKQSQKKVRKSNVSNGGNYKKYYPQWDICDFKIRLDLEKEDKPWKYSRK